MENTSKKTELKTRVLDRIEQEDLNPRSSFYFKCHELTVWVLWVLSVLIGALAIAVSLFAITYQKYAFYEATHENLITFMVEALPYLWFVILVFMILLAVFNVRNTKKGYRYPLWQIVISSLVFSFVGGYAMHFAGMGFMIDQKLGEYIAMYQSQEKMESRLWQNPGEGRLVGFLALTENTSGDEKIIFKDIKNTKWEVNVTNLQEDDFIILNSGKKMKVLGQVLSFTPPRFHACGVLPWMFEKNMSVNELSRERRGVIKRIYSHKDNDLSHKQLEDSLEKIDLCRELEAISRLHMMPR